MQDAMTVTVALAGLFFSFACALLLEELLFGGIFRLFFGDHGRRNQAATPVMQMVALRRQKKSGAVADTWRDDNYYL